MTEPSAHSKREEDTGLVPLLLLMTVVTGIVDAVSILRLGHVFVANMTGNVVFLGFALGGSPGFSVSASLVALGAFLAGFEAVMVAAAAATAAASHGTSQRYVMTILLAVAMGAQNVTVRKLAVADLTTTVLTLTLTGLAADPPDLTKPDAHAIRRLAAVTSMLAGAVAGAIIVLHGSTGWALSAAMALLIAVAIAARFGAQQKGPAAGDGNRR
jgi:uncharacterized membrane protein YoaK (UPF0700 family)